MNRYSLCPCDSKQTYTKCCKLIHDGTAARTAEALMRSRYAAYALGLVDYIIQTTHPQNPSYSHDRAQWKTELEQFSQATSFLGLRLTEAIEGDERSFVSFTAFLRQGSEDVSFSEKSSFVRENDQWFYLDGETLQQKA